MTWTSHLRPALAGLSIYDSPAVSARARLHANECAEPWPAEVMAELGRRLQSQELGRYPDSSGRSLRELLSQRHSCHPDAVVLGNGSDEVISLLLTALAGWFTGDDRGAGRAATGWGAAVPVRRVARGRCADGARDLAPASGAAWAAGRK